MYSPAAEEGVRLFLKYGVVGDPWLTAIHRYPTLEPDAAALVSDAVHEIAQAPLDRRLLGSWPVTDAQVQDAVREVILSSAAFDAFMERGEPALSIQSLQEAIRRVRLLVREGGLARLLLGYGYTALVENLMAVRHYGRMREDDFISGRLHRPWIARSLEHELAAGLAMHHYELVVADDGRYVRLTRKGHETWRDSQALWQVTGYAKTRLRLSMMAEFMHLGDLDELSEIILPGFMDLRRAFIAESGIPRHADLLEIGSGSGLLTFDAGLYETLAPRTLTLLDPSPVLTAIAKRKAAKLRARRTRFVRGVAEALPFPPDAFDHVLAFAVMQYTDRARALEELFRVLRPGGILMVSAPLHVPALEAPIMKRWFKPLNRPSHGPFVFLAPEDIPTHGRAAGFEILDVSEH